MNKNTVQVLLILLLTIGLVFIGGNEIINISGEEGIAIDNSGSIFTIFLLLVLLVFYRNSRSKSDNTGSRYSYAFKYILSCYALSGVLFVVLFVFLLALKGEHGASWVTSNFFWIIGGGFLVSMPFVYRYLR